MRTNWDKFHVPECPACKTDDFVEEISLPGAYICRVCGTSMMDGGGPVAGSKDGTPKLPRSSSDTGTHNSNVPTLGRMEEDH